MSLPLGRLTGPWGMLQERLHIVSRLYCCILLYYRCGGLLASKLSCRYAFVSLSLQSYESFSIRTSSSHSFIQLRLYQRHSAAVPHYSAPQFHKPAMSAPLPLTDPPAKPSTTLDASSTAPPADNPLTEPWSVQSGTSLPLKPPPQVPISI